MKTFEGKLTVNSQERIAIVVSRFNEIFTSKLKEAAVDCYIKHGADEAQIDVYWVPGCFEIPLTLQGLAETGRYSAMVALGAVIRGATPHFDYVSSEVSKGVSKVSLESKTPIGFGILTCNNLEQALERSGSKAGNKGWEAALATIEHSNIMAQIKENS
ncbi:MAG: 6,7-dimethyl-8-ribityllumazine synthase [Halobacteriovoraceae bacterium]|nr:6,7-dimethyl-8-ribityllumazine synthase [Halobacteriovoraceae bacterium]MCB9095746.1 6,7-dimethyl-8-ribityllumazine synthase [Halobacteriovoraceae bacterium]